MATVKVNLKWKFALSQLQKNTWKTRKFIVAYNNVPFQLDAEIFLNTTVAAPDSFNFRLSYDDIPSMSEENANYELSVSADGALVISNVYACLKFDHVYGKFPLPIVDMTEGDQICLLVAFDIPTWAFSSPYGFPFVEVAQSWLFHLFDKIEDPDNGYDVKLMSSSEGSIFYGHKSILQHQSKPLAAMFRIQQTMDEQNGIYRFPTLTKEGLKLLLQHLYTGLTEIGRLSVIEIIEVAHVGDQYELKNLVQSCDASLWKRVVQEPDQSVEVIRYAQLRGLKLLKQRAMDVLVENLDDIPFTSQQFGSDQLTDEFAQYSARRVFFIQMN